MSAPSSGFSTTIERHLGMLRRKCDESAITELLARAELKLEGDAVRQVGGTTVDQQACARYLQAVGERFGDAAASFARVNFALAGCKV